MIDTDEQKLIDLSKKVAAVTCMSWQEVRRAIQSFVGVAKSFSMENQINDLISEIKHSSRPRKKGLSSWWIDSPERKELVTRHGPRFLEKPRQTHRRRF